MNQLSPFQIWEMEHRELINEVLVPIGLVVILVVTLWGASQ